MKPFFLSLIQQKMMNRFLRLLCVFTITIFSVSFLCLNRCFNAFSNQFQLDNWMNAFNLPMNNIYAHHHHHHYFRAYIDCDQFNGIFFIRLHLLYFVLYLYHHQPSIYTQSTSPLPILRHENPSEEENETAPVN